MRSACAAAAALLAWTGCAINPVTGEAEFTTLSNAREIEMGHEMALQVQRQVGILEDPELAAYIEKLGATLAEHSARKDVPYRFQVVDMEEPNAFALPGGYVYVSRGLLALTASEAELAGVVGHEIGHVAAKHVAQREARKTGVGILSTMTGILGGAVGGSAGMQSLGGVAELYGAGVIASYSRDQERQADKIGQEIAGASGYDPAAMSSFLMRLGRYTKLKTQGAVPQGNFFDSHPPTEERVQATAYRAKSLEAADAETLSKSRGGYYAKLIGLPLGPDPKHGVIVRGRFIHPTRGFAFDLPPGWAVAVSPNQVAGAAPNGQALVEVARQGGPRDPATASSSFSRANRLYLEEERPLTINGLPAYHARARTSSDVGPLVVDLTWISHPQGVYRIMGASPADTFPGFASTFAAIAQSFHRSTEFERAAVRKRQLWIARSQPGETLEALSRRTRNVWTLEQTALANDLDPGVTFADEQMVKIAVDLPYRP